MGAGITRRTILLAFPVCALAVTTKTFAQGAPLPLAKALGKLKEPVPLSDGVVLVDIRVNGQYVVAEMENTTDSWLSTAPVTVTFYDTDDNILGATTVTPMDKAIGPYQTLPLSGQFSAPQFSEDEWVTVDCIRCTADGEDDVLAIAKDAAFTVERTSNTKVDKGSDVTGIIKNHSASNNATGVAYIIVRDSEDRVWCYGDQSIGRDVPAGKTARFSYQLRVYNSTWGLPFSEIEGQEYKIQVVAGIPSTNWGYSCPTS